MANAAGSGSRPADVWALGAAYEPYVGRWSRLVAQEFLAWLAVPPGCTWLDVGCGTGALTQTVLERCAPRAVTGVDPAAGFLAYARATLLDGRAAFRLGDARALPVEDGAYQAVVSGLALNFVPEPAQAAAEMARAAAPGAVVAAYVWDYAGEMQFMRRFWDAAAALHPPAAELDEGRRFPLCHPTPLADLFRAAGLADVSVRPIDVWTVFADFDDYWQPFLGGQGPAPSYVMSLDADDRAALRERLRAELPTAADGSIPLLARSWAVQGVRPGGSPG